MLQLAPQQRKAALCERFGDDIESLRAAEGLIESEEAAASEFLARSVPERLTNPELDRDPMVAKRVGPYRIEERIGAGGMGTVYRAMRADGEFTNEVAVKLVRRGMDSERVLARFRRERQVLARLRHPGIAVLLDGGSTDDGLPYLVMEFVDGEPIDVWCRNRSLDLRSKLQLFTAACDAVAHAHESGVVHRDLKPHHILVPPDGNPKLLDFGIAKLLDPSDGDGQVLTETGQHLLTPRYASPEQIEGGQVGPASDVYSLGVVLFELLCERSPYDEWPTTESLRRAILDQQPSAPSRSAETTTSRRQLQGELDWIVLTALRKEPHRRYPTVSDFAADLRSYLAGERIQARPESLLYRVSRAWRTHRVLFTAAAIVLASTLTFLISTAKLREGETRAKETAGVREREAAWQEYRSTLASGVLAIENNDLASARQHLDSAPDEYRDWEWRFLMSRLETTDEQVFGTDPNLIVRRVALSDDERELSAVLRDETVITWDVTSGSAVTSWPIPQPSAQHFALSSGARLLAYQPITGSDSLSLKIVEPTEDGDELYHEELDAMAGALQFDPTGEYLAAGFYDGRVSVIDVELGEEMWSTDAHEHQIQWRGITFSADGELLASGSLNGEVAVWDVQAGDELIRIQAHELAIGDMAFHPTDDTLTTTALDQVVKTWRLETGELQRSWTSDSLLYRLLYSADGETLWSAALDTTIQRRAPETGFVLDRLQGHTHTVLDLVLSADERTLFSSSTDFTARAWDVRSLSSETVRLDAGQILDFEVNRAGDRLYASSRGYPLRLFDRTGKLITAQDNVWHGREFALTPDETRCYVSHPIHGLVEILDAATLERLAQLEVAAGPVQSLTAASEVDILAVSSQNSPIITLFRDGVPLEQFESEGEVMTLLLSRDGRRLFSFSKREPVRVWDVDTGQFEQLSHLPHVIFNMLSLNQDETILAATSRDGALALWTLDTGERKLLTQQGRGLEGSFFLPGSSRILTVSAPSSIHVWEVESGDVLASISTPVPVAALRYDEPNATVLVACQYGSILRWSAPDVD